MVCTLVNTNYNQVLSNVNTHLCGNYGCSIILFMLSPCILLKLYKLTANEGCSLSTQFWFPSCASDLCATYTISKMKRDEKDVYLKQMYLLKVLYLTDAVTLYTCRNIHGGSILNY